MLSQSGNDVDRNVSLISVVDAVTPLDHAFGDRVSEGKTRIGGRHLAVAHISLVTVEIDTVQIDVGPVGIEVTSRESKGDGGQKDLHGGFWKCDRNARLRLKCLMSALALSGQAIKKGAIGALRSSLKKRWKRRVYSFG